MSARKKDNAVIIALITGVVTIIVAFLSSPYIVPLFTPSTLTPIPTIPPPTSTSTITPTVTPTHTSTATPTNTPLPPPLAEIFPQIDGGQEFSFVNNGGVFTPEFVLDLNCVHSGVYGLRITYSMQGQANGGWGMHWVNSPVGYFDPSGFNTLTFWVRGAAGSESFQVAIKDTDRHEFWIASKSKLVVPPDWAQVSIPLSDFKNVNKSSLSNISFGFNRDHGSGSICIDDIAFTANP